MDRHLLELQTTILQSLGAPLPAGAAVLDLGCGNGWLAPVFLEHGYRYAGCDFPDSMKGVREGSPAAALLRPIEPALYRLPFADASFDFVFSNQVFEHVQDYPAVLAEIHRVLKPGGAGLHFFPARYKPMEGHLKVPLASFIQWKWWLALWAVLGFRPRGQQRRPLRETVERNFAYLRDHTNYLPTAELRRHFSGQFPDYRFCEAAFITCHYRSRRWIQALNRTGLLAPLYRNFWRRTVFIRKG